MKAWLIEKERGFRILGVIVIGLLETMALSRGIDGTSLTAALTMIGILLGAEWGQLIGRKKQIDKSIMELLKAVNELKERG